MSENPKSMEALAAQSARIHRLALAIAQDRHVAEDLAQDAWVSLLRGSGPAPRNLPGWLAGTMGNLFRTRVRSERRRADHERANACEDLEAGSASAMEPLELHEALVRAVRELKEPYRTTVLLRWFEDLEPLEIARRTGVPVRTVHTRVTRALEMLRAKLHRAGYGESWSMWIALAPLAWIRHAGEAALAVKTKTKILLAAAALATASVTIAVILPRAAPGPISTAAAPEMVHPQLEEPIHETPAAELSVATRQSVQADPAPFSAAPPARQEAAISGFLRVRGQIPTEPITLQLLDGADPQKSELKRVTVTDGSFSFDGLEDGLRGLIRLPRRYFLARAQPRERLLEATAPCEKLLIDLERTPSLTGRLASRASGLPVEDSRVTVVVTWSDGGQTMLGADVEPRGLFFAPLSESRTVDSVKLDVKSPDGLVGNFSFSRDQIPPDLDLGELHLEVGLLTHVRVLDAHRAPIAGAHVRAHGLNAPTAETDSAGRATLGGLEQGAKFSVLARGFDPAVLEAPTVEAILEVVLERATRLTVRVLDPKGAPASGVQLQVSAETPMFSGTEGPPDPFLVPQVPIDGAISGQEVQRKRFFVWFTTDDEGVVALQSLVPGLPLQFSVMDEIETRVLDEYVAPLRAQEVRELVLRLPYAPRTLSGVVEDSAGRPVERAQVKFHDEGHAYGKLTDANGRFQFEHLFATEANLEIERRGYVNVRMKDVPIQEDGYPLRIVLEAGRDARVRVSDETEASVDLGSLSARLLSGERAWYAENAEDGCRTLLDLPIQELEVRLELAGKTFSAQLGARQEELELRVPTLGRLEVTCAPAPSMVRDRMGVRLRSLGEEGLEQWVQAFAAKPAVFDAVLPGDYELGYVTWESPESDDEVVLLVPLGETIRVRIEAGQTERVELR